jgi:hypothetical protein
VVTRPVDLSLVDRCRCVDQHERGSQTYARCPLTADGDHGYCMGCHPDTRRDQLRQAVIHGAIPAGISIELAVAEYDALVGRS